MVHLVLDGAFDWIPNHGELFLLDAEEEMVAAALYEVEAENHPKILVIELADIVVQILHTKVVR